MADKANPSKQDPAAVVFYTYPKLLFAWPLIVMGYLFYFLPETWNGPLGWTYLIITSLVVLTIGVDLERNYAVFWSVFAALVFVLGLYLGSIGIPVLDRVYNWFASQQVQYNDDFGLVLSIFLSVPYAIMFIWTRLQHKWRITHNEFEHYAFGRADDSLARGAKRVRSTYPDLLELLLAGAGTLIVYSATGRSELRRIPHVPLLFLVRRRINRILETTAVTTTVINESVVEEEMDDEVEGLGAGEESGGDDASKDPL